MSAPSKLALARLLGVGRRRKAAGALLGALFAVICLVLACPACDTKSKDDTEESDEDDSESKKKKKKKKANRGAECKDSGFVELTKVDITKKKDFTADKASLYCIHLGTPRREAMKLITRTGRFYFNKHDTGSLLDVHERVERKSSYTGGEQLFTLSFKEDVIDEIWVYSQFVHLAGDTKKLLTYHDAPKDWLGEGRKDFYKASTLHYDKRGIRLLLTKGSSWFQLYKPPQK